MMTVFDKHPKFTVVITFLFIGLIAELIFLGIVEFSGGRAKQMPDHPTKWRSEILRYSDFGNLPGAGELYDELQAAYRWRYFPYVTWRNEPFSSLNVNVNYDGSRQTMHIESTGKTKKIWAFGGSSTWGWLNADDQTWPSHLVHELASNEIKADVTNYGENGFTFTQNVIDLIRLLSFEAPPDAVVFFVGYNDAEISFYPHFLPGYHGGVDTFQKKLTQEEKIPSMWGTTKYKATEIKDVLAKHSYFIYWLDQQIIAFAAAKIATKKPKQAEEPKIDYSLPENFDGLSVIRYDQHLVRKNRVVVDDALVSDSLDIAVKSFLSFSQVVHSLANDRGFEYFIVLQPSLFVSPRRHTKWQKRILDWENMLNRKKLATDDIFYANLLSTKRKDLNLVDARHLFDEESQLVFFDPVHLTNLGNKLVAKKISRLFINRWKQNY